MERATPTYHVQVIFACFPANMFYDAHHLKNYSIHSISVPSEWNMDGTVVNIRRNTVDFIFNHVMSCLFMRHGEDGNFSDA